MPVKSVSDRYVYSGEAIVLFQTGPPIKMVVPLIRPCSRQYATASTYYAFGTMETSFLIYEDVGQLLQEAGCSDEFTQQFLAAMETVSLSRRVAEKVCSPTVKEIAVSDASATGMASPDMILAGVFDSAGTGLVSPAPSAEWPTKSPAGATA